MSRGTPPRDEEFLKKLTNLQENDLLVYPLIDPEARIRGLYQHPLQKVVRNQGVHQKKKFHCFKWLNQIYVVRLNVPNEEALRTPIPSQGVQSESNQSRGDADDVGPSSVDARNVRTPGSGGSDST